MSRALRQLRAKRAVVAGLATDYIDALHGAESEGRYGDAARRDALLKASAARLEDIDAEIEALP